MSGQEKASGEDQSGGAANDSNSNVQTQEELKAELETLRKVKADLLSEKKAAQTKLSQFEKDQQERERLLLEEQGKHKELYQKEREERLKLGEKLKSKLMDQSVKDALRLAGCSDEKKLSKLMNFKTVANYGDKVKFDDDFQADQKTLSDFVNEIKTEFSDLGFFSKEAPSSKDVDPTNAKDKDFSQMTPSEREAYKLKLLQGK